MTTNLPTKKPVSALINQLTSDSFKKQVALALPKHLTPDRFLRIALTEIRKNPKLEECEPKSFLGAIVQCSQLGLEPGDSLGRAYLLPYKNNKKGIMECQLIIGYKGLLDLARRSGELSGIEARCIFENETVEIEYGLDQKLKHIPAILTDPGNLIAVYAIANFKDGGKQFELMSVPQINAIRATSKTAGSSYSPWATHFEEMAKKTVLRRLCKYLPMSIEKLEQAIIVDEKADVGKQAFDTVYEGEFEENSTKEMPKKVSQANKMADKLESKEDTKEAKEFFGE